jgi:cell division inhibitor SepF
MQNFMVYEPKNADDVQTLIDFLKTRESAIINLDNVDPAVSQRVLDFVSGAIYALNGSVHRIAGNIFLLSPEGVGITNSYGIRNDNDRK